MLDRPALPPGWLSSDEDEIALRRWRGRTEILSVKALEPEHSYFGTFRAQSASGGSYEVEIRSFDGLANSCGCIDYRVNGLGTCKHIEGTIAAMARGRAKSFRAAKAGGNPRVEVYLDRRSTAMPAIMWPAEGTGRSFKLARDWLRDYLAADGTLTRDPQRIESLISAWNTAPDAIRRILRVSRHFTPGSTVLAASSSGSKRASPSKPISRRDGKRWISLRTRCCPTSAKACSISPSASAPCWPTKWDWAKLYKALRPACCWQGSRRSSVLW